MSDDFNDSHIPQEPETPRNPRSASRRAQQAQPETKAEPEQPHKVASRASRGREEGKPPSRRSKYRLAIVLGAVLVILGGGVALAARIVSLINHPQELFTPVPTSAPTATSTALIGWEETAAPEEDPEETLAPTVDPTPSETPVDYQFDSNHLNIVILGMDLDQERIRQGMNARTDCIMLFSVDLQTKKVSIVSVPRDTYTRIYNDKGKGSGYNRINAAFSYGGGLKRKGLDYSLNTVSNFMGGIPIDYYVVFDMDLVKDLVNSLPHGLYFNMDLDLVVDNYHFVPGPINLNGDLVLRYARLRHTAGGDFGRVDRQQKVMVALFEQLKKQKQLSMVPKLYEALRNNVTTNLSDLQIAALAWFCRDLEMSAITRYTIPGKSLNLGASYVIADQKEKARIIKEVFGVDAPTRKEESYSYLKGKLDAAVAKGRNIVNQAKALLANESRYFSADEAAGLNSAIANWSVAASKHKTDDLEELQRDVETEYTVLSNLVSERKAAIADGQQAIRWAQENLSKYTDYITPGKKDMINNLIAKVQARVDDIDYRNVGAASDELKNKANPVFVAADEAMKGAENSPPPTPEPSDTPEPPGDTPGNSSEPTEDPTATPKPSATAKPTRQSATPKTTPTPAPAAS